MMETRKHLAAEMVIGLASKDRNLSRARMKEIMDWFQERNGATQCILLKGVGTGKLLRFTLPTIGMMVFTSLYGVVDGFFVSNFAGKDAFAAVNLVWYF